jgi:methylated-DNA-[protein]-cysteine S-methyltransferase
VAISLQKKLTYTVFQTNQGWMGLLASQTGIVAATLPQTTRQQAIDLLGTKVKQADFSPDKLSSLTQRFQDYYSGKKIVFPDALDFSGATGFQKQVWQAAQLIPHGETRSYGWIAKQIGKPRAARAVGQALGKNPFLVIVPCHRVIAGDGTLGGFGCGLPAKQKLLKLEKSK